jgi:hypothetical protein
MSFNREKLKIPKSVEKQKIGYQRNPAGENRHCTAGRPELMTKTTSMIGKPEQMPKTKIWNYKVSFCFMLFEFVRPGQ